MQLVDSRAAIAWCCWESCISPIYRARHRHWVRWGCLPDAPQLLHIVASLTIVVIVLEKIVTQAGTLTGVTQLGTPR